MNPSIFFDNFALLAGSPNGVQKLREMILQLAVQGKLLPQDPNDEPASVLLEKIGEEKNKLIKAKLIRNSKPLPYVREEEYLFEIPTSWRWIRLGEIGDWGSGSTPDRKKLEYYDGTIRWFKSGELNNGYISESEEKITDIALNDCSLRLNKPGDVLIAMYGATIGKVAILKTEATTNQAVCACTCFNGLHNDYLFLLLKAYKQHFTGQGAGGAQPNISREKIINTVFPLPPLEEQKRIVAKVDQLMTLCDELEALHQHRNESRVHLNNAAINKLLDAGSVNEFNELWQLIYNNFDLLYDNLDNVATLRQTILQLAVMGKLVPQDPNDEPASALLEKIREEKERLQNIVNIRNSEPSQPVEVDEYPFDKPDGWLFSRIENLFLISSGTTPSRTNHNYYTDGTENWVKTTDLNNGLVLSCEEKITLQAVKDCNLKYYPQGTVCIAMYGGEGTIGKSGILGMMSTINQSVCAIVPSSFVDSNFLHYYLKSIRADWMKFAAGLRKAPNINAKIVRNMIFPLPPLEEQKRIVAKVDQLMALCDELEMRIRKSQEDGEKITNAVVSNLTAM